MKLGSGWKPLGFTFFVVITMLAMAAIFGTGSGAIVYDRAAAAIPFEPPSASLNIPDQAEGDVLTAQQWAAWAAIISAGVGVATLLTLTFTLYVTLGMLKQAELATEAAKDAAKITEKMGRKQVQAYLSISDQKLNFQPHQFAGRVSLKLRNTGNSPVADVEFVLRSTLLYASQDGGAKLEAWDQLGVRDIAGREEYNLVDFRLSLDRITAQRPQSGPDEVSIAIISVCAFGSDVFGEEIWSFARFVQLIPFDPENVMHKMDLTKTESLDQFSIEKLVSEHRKHCEKRKYDPKS